MVQILGLDVAGNPAQWLSSEQAVTKAVTGGIAWQWGDRVFVFRGGWNRHGERSIVELRPIVALAGRKPDTWMREELPLTNALLFRRDRHTCAYCGGRFSPRDLSRDHVVPRVQGGKDVWTNVVTACRVCNQRKGGRRPEQVRGLSLLFVPYAPCLWEHFILSSREIVVDQMDFLAARVPEYSRVFDDELAAAATEWPRIRVGKRRNS
ncbi:MAG: HNH endonuclease [Candidatus Accumulibacter sp.]|nr:HNH endonuclease [Accumulibacter sp.]